ncbi:MAG TPA: hypothetical protein VFA46_20935 [Actinomycetes bacterium]|nr:hypothetical protein [Actinomycetes bacterium]
MIVTRAGAAPGTLGVVSGWNVAALVTSASQEQPPRRFMAGADSIGLAERKVADLQAQLDAFRDLSTSLALDDLQPAGTRR